MPDGMPARAAARTGVAAIVLQSPFSGRETDDPLAEVRERDSSRRCRLRNQAQFRHARQGVGLQTETTTRIVHAEVDACIATQLQRPECPLRMLLYDLRDCRVQPCRELLDRHA